MIDRKIYNDGLFVVTECSGKVTVEELITSAYWMVDNFGDLVKEGFKQLFVAMDADVSAISEEDIRRIAQINLVCGRNRGGFSMAILASRPYPVALAKLHKLLSAVADIRVEIFDDIEVAYKWLELEKPQD